MKKTTFPSSIRSSENKSFSDCLAQILGAELNEIPAAPDDLGLEKIGYWLAAQNLALIPVRAPECFQWAGWWIGRLEGGDGYVVMAGTPSGVAWVPEGVMSGCGDVLEGWVIAPPCIGSAQPR